MIKARDQKKKKDTLTKWKVHIPIPKYNEGTIKLNDHSNKQKVHIIILKDHVTKERSPIRIENST